MSFKSLACVQVDLEFWGGSHLVQPSGQCWEVSLYLAALLSFCAVSQSCTHLLHLAVLCVASSPGSIIQSAAAVCSGEGWDFRGFFCAHLPRPQLSVASSMHVGRLGHLT